MHPNASTAASAAAVVSACGSVSHMYIVHRCAVCYLVSLHSWLSLLCILRGLAPFYMIVSVLCQMVCKCRDMSHPAFSVSLAGQPIRSTTQVDVIVRRGGSVCVVLKFAHVEGQYMNH